MYTNILGYKVFNKSKSELLKKIDSMDKVNIVSGNPEVLYSGLNNEMLNHTFNSLTTSNIPDSIFKLSFK